MEFILVTNTWSLIISSLKFHINPTKALGIIMFFHLLWKLSKVFFLKLISTNSQVIHFQKWKNNQSSNESHKLIIEFILLKQWNEQYTPKNVHHGLSHILCLKVWACIAYPSLGYQHIGTLREHLKQCQSKWSIEIKTLSFQMHLQPL